MLPGVRTAIIHSQKNGFSCRSCCEVMCEGICTYGRYFIFSVRKKVRVCSAVSGEIGRAAQRSSIALLLRGGDAVAGGVGIPSEWKLHDEALAWLCEVCWPVAGDVASQSVGMLVDAPLVWSNDTMLSSFASSWAVLEAEERPFRFRTVGDGRHSLFSR